MKKQYKQGLNNSSNLLSQIIDSSPIPTFAIDTEHKVTLWNRACELVTGVSGVDVIGTKDAWRALYTEKRPILSELIIDEREDEIERLYEGKIRRSTILDGSWEAENFFPHLPYGGKWLVFSANPLKDEQGKIIGAVETIIDITERKRSESYAQDTQHLLTQIIEGCPVPLFVLGGDHKITHWNRACEAIIGTPASEIIGTNNQWKAFYSSERPVLADLVLSNDRKKLTDYYRDIWAESKLIDDAWEATDYFPNFRNGARWLSFTAAPIYGKDGDIMGAVETLQDITHQKEYEEKLKYEATHDSLTGLANRLLLYDRLKQAIAYVERENQLLAVLFIDMDNFKTINDTLGHSAGDQLIRDTGKSISRCVRSIDTVSRLGGDEFVVILFSPDNQEHVSNIVKRINSELSKVYTINGHEFYISSSIGIAMFPHDGKDVDTLMMNADNAMYQTKAKNKGGFHFFTQEMNKQVRKHFEIENNLHKAIKENQFELVYQPIFNLKTEAIIAAEALIRWRHPVHGMVSPAEFIPIAEESDLIIDIGNWVLETAIGEAYYWLEQYDKKIRVSINISARQFHNNSIHNALENLFKRVNISLLDIELELTENIVMHNPVEAQESLKELSELGVTLAMDDFGTGYSSLAYIRRFPFDLIKIDKAFVKDLGNDDEAEAIVRTVLELGRALGLRMLAEGVETEVQRDFLKRESCDEVQGFLFSKPLAVEDFRKLLCHESQSNITDLDV